MTVSGTTNITGNKKGTGDAATANNVYLESGKIITIGTDGLDAKASIGVTMATKPTSSAPAAITGANSADYHDCFISDNANYETYNDTAGGASSQIVKLKVSHIHSWTYALSKSTSDNDTVTATCGNVGCTATVTKLTIVAPTFPTYDGSKEASAAI